MWKKTDKDMKWFIRNVHQDVAWNFLSIHDESDLVVDDNILAPVVNKINKVSSLKYLIDTFGGRSYINFIFDNEYDPYGSFTATKKFVSSTYDIECIKFFLKKNGFMRGDKPVAVQKDKKVVWKVGLNDLEGVGQIPFSEGGHRLYLLLAEEDYSVVHETDCFVDPVILRNFKVGEVLENA